MIELRGVTKRYAPDTPPAVDALDLHVERGTLLALLGESGCGKTTTLKMVNRLIEPTAGTITVGGRDVMHADPVTLRRSIGYVFQGVGLFPHMTIVRNIGVVPHLLGWKRDDIDARVRELLQLVGLPPDDFAHRRPRELSGGQRQRVGVARALAARPAIMLMDEPFGALDPLTRDALQEEYVALHRSLGLTTVMVTHDMTEALLMADTIAVMHAGRILQRGTPHELITRPADERVAAMMHTPRKQADRLEALVEAAE